MKWDDFAVKSVKDVFSAVEPALGTEEAGRILGTCVNIVKILGILCAPILPEFHEKLKKQLNVADLKWDDINFNLKNHKTGKAEIVFEKMEEVEEIEVKGKEVRDIKINVDRKVEELGMKVVIAQINGVKVKKKHEGLEKLKKDSCIVFKASP